MITRRVVALAGSLAVVLVLGVAAQIDRGAVTGKVTDENGRPMQGVEVTVRGADNPGECTSKTDKSGEYFCGGLRAGAYDILISFKGSSVKCREKAKVSVGIYGDPNAPGFHNRVDCRLRPVSGQSPEAAKKAEEEQKEAVAGFDRAVALNKAGKYAEALAELEPLMQKDPKQWAVHYHMALAYEGLGRNEEAEAAYKKAIELNPQEGGLYSALGSLYLKMKRTEDARKYFDSAAELSPENAAVYYFNLGITLYNAGDLKSAIEPFRRSTELDPSRADAYYWLGVCLVSEAQYKTEGSETKIIPAPGTREAFEQYLALAPDGKYVNDAKDALEAIGAPIPTSVRVRKKQ